MEVAGIDVQMIFFAELLVSEGDDKENNSAEFWDLGQNWLIFEGSSFDSGPSSFWLEMSPLVEMLFFFLLSSA